MVKQLSEAEIARIHREQLVARQSRLAFQTRWRAEQIEAAAQRAEDAGHPERAKRFRDAANALVKRHAR